MVTATVTLIKNDVEGVVMNRSLNDIINQLPAGRYRIVFEPRRQKHSVPQHRLFFMWMALLSRETGLSKPFLYRHYCKKFLLEDMPSIADMSNLQLSQFMLEIQADAVQELGILLPSNEDGDDFITFYNEYKDR